MRLAFLQWIALLFPAAAAAAGAARAEEAALRWRLEKGETLRYRMTVDQRTRHFGAGSPTNGPGDAVETAQRTRIVWRLSVREIDLSGNARVACRYEEVAVDLHQLMLGRIAWDSTKKEDAVRADDPAVRPFSKLVGREFSFALAPDGRIVEVAGFDAVAKELLDGVEDNPVAVAALTSAFGEDAVRAALERSFAVLPPAGGAGAGESGTGGAGGGESGSGGRAGGEASGSGGRAGASTSPASWRRAVEQAVPILGRLRYETDYTLVARDAARARISGAVRVAVVPEEETPVPAPRAAAPERDPGNGGSGAGAVRPPPSAAARDLARALDVALEDARGEIAVEFAAPGHLRRSETRLSMRVRSSARPPIAPRDGPGAARDEAHVEATIVVERVD